MTAPLVGGSSEARSACALPVVPSSNVSEGTRSVLQRFATAVVSMCNLESFMKKFVVLSFLAATPVLGLAGSSIAAPPSPQIQDYGRQNSLVEKVRRDCVWVDNRWTYERGGKRLVCRPDRPTGLGWQWHREGERYGWYHGARRSWHYNNW